jgi:hypothetical protein
LPPHLHRRRVSRPFLCAFDIPAAKLQRVLDGERVAVAAARSFPCSRILPIPGRHLVEDDVARHHHPACTRIKQLVRLAAFLVPQEHHACTPVLQLANEWLRVLHMANATERPEEGDVRLPPVPRHVRCLVLECFRQRAV